MTEHVRPSNGHRRYEDFDHRSPEEIQRELDATRHEMANTLHAIQQELSSGQLMVRALDLVRAGPGRFTQNLGQTIVNNPVPIAMIGVGILWLAKAQPEGGVHYDTGDTLRDKAEGLRDKVSHVTERARELKDEASERAHDLKERSEYRMRRSIDSVQRTWQDNPMLIGFCALAAGALLAATLPKTRREREVIGPARDRLVEGVKQGVQSGLQEGSQPAVETYEVPAVDEPLTTDLDLEDPTVR